MSPSENLAFSCQKRGKHVAASNLDNRDEKLYSVRNRFNVFHHGQILLVNYVFVTVLKLLLENAGTAHLDNECVTILVAKDCGVDVATSYLLYDPIEAIVFNSFDKPSPIFGDLVGVLVCGYQFFREANLRV